MRLVSYAVCLVLLALVSGATLGGISNAQGLPGTEASPARLEMLDPLSDVILPRLYPVIATDVSPSLGDATLINRINLVVSLGMVDAAAPYHETAVGMYTRLPRRPEAERSVRNINTAMLHAAFQTLVGLLPDREPVWREMLLDYGLDPDDASADTSTAVGIGNVAGAAAIAGRLYDGMNQTGDYQDTTGYMPVNTAFCPARSLTLAAWPPAAGHGRLFRTALCHASTGKYRTGSGLRPALAARSSARRQQGGELGRLPGTGGRWYWKSRRI